MNLQKVIEDVHQNAIKKGFWNDYQEIMKQHKWAKAYNNEFNSEDEHFKYLSDLWENVRLNWIFAQLALIHSEVSEMEEAEAGENFAEELADICIRVFDLIGGLEIDINNIKVSMLFGPTYIYPGRSINWHISQSLEQLRKEDGFPFERSLLFIYGRCKIEAEKYGVDLEVAIRKKMEYNKTRPYKHGKQL